MNMDEEQPLVNESQDRKSFKKGDTVVANYRRLGAYYTGKIGTENGDGTYNIFYDDGEEEENVVKAHIIHLPPTVLGRQFKEGDYVLANCRGGGKLFPGRIIRCHRNPGSAFSRFDVKYDDNSSESDVLDYNLRFLARESPSSVNSRPLNSAPSNPTPPQRRPSIESSEPPSLRAGDRIEAMHGGLQRYISGFIVSVYSSPPSCDIEYDKDCLTEGAAHFERNISYGQVRLVQWKIGDLVLVDFRGRGKFFPGRIHIVNQDAQSSSAAFLTYDIAYEDGDYEAKVSRSRIRPRHWQANLRVHTTSSDKCTTQQLSTALTLREEDSIGCFCCYPNVTKQCPVICCCCIAWVHVATTCRLRFVYRTCWRSIARTCCCYCFGCCGGWCPFINVQVGDYPHFSDSTDCWWDCCYCGCPDTR